MAARLLLLSFFLVASSLAQSTLQLSARAVLATPPTLMDVQLTGTAKWETGPDKESGTVILKARRDGKSRMDLQLGSAVKAEVRVNDPRDPHAYFQQNSQWHESAMHNGWSDANWFFPAFSVITTAPERSFQLTSTGANSIRAQFNALGQRADLAKTVQVLSTTDFLLDPVTYLPTSMRWTTHPDDDMNVGITVEVRYSDYRNVSGVKIPFRLQRFVNGSLQLDVTISSVAINPGISISDFSPVVTSEGN